MSKQYSLHAIKTKINRLAAQIGASADLLPTYGYSMGGARPHVEVDARGYHYVVVERGQEISRVTTNDLDELLYQVFKDVTFALAGKYELKHRVAHQDSRRILFQYQIELLSMLFPKWGEVESQVHKKILEKHPYDDHASVRADLTKRFREQGLSPELAWKKACEQYPLPIQ